MASYGPEIDQSQHAKSVSHIIKTIMCKNILRIFENEIPKIFKKQSASVQKLDDLINKSVFYKSIQ